MKKVSLLGIALLTFIGVGTITLFNACEDDPCKDVTCVNGACVDGSCDCDPGWEGSDCSEKSADKYVGTWDGLDVCTSGNYTFTATISASSTADDGILITNFGGFGTSVVVNATVDGDSFTVPSQVFGAVTISGSGTLTSDGLTINVSYTANDGSTSDVCAGTWSKQ